MVVWDITSDIRLPTIVTDLTRMDICVPVVRVFVRGLEVLTLDPDRIRKSSKCAANNEYNRSL